ncbi:MAG: sulfatase [Planctomycetota bacterium]|nr:MAG: sulfatase [Planctomycetota bacterium]
MEKCNIIYLHTHDCGRYVQPYGYPVSTPNIQILAEGGITFRQAHAASPTCSPSRGALVTGSSPHSCGMTGLAGMGFALKNPEQHMLFTLRDAGFSTTLIGQQHVAEDSNTIGYDEVIPFPEISRRNGGHTFKASVVAPAAAEWLSKKRTEPFFLNIGMDDTHRIWPEPGPEDDPRFVRPPEPIPDNPVTRKDFACYRTSARTLDKGIGLILEALDKNGLSENTLVICTTDHGLGFPRMKSSLYDGGTGVMLIIKGPGGFNGGQVSDALVSQIDIFPTVCELLGIQPPSWLEGRSMMPLMRGEYEEVNEHIFTEINYHGGYDPTRAVRTQRYKYIKHFKTPNFPARTSNQRKGPTLELWIEKGWRERPYPNEELYDLFFDPNEADNLAEKPAFLNILNSMQGRMQRWMEYTSDPLLAGEVPQPQEGTIYDVDSRCIKGTPPLPDCMRLSQEAPNVNLK